MKSNVIPPQTTTLLEAGKLVDTRLMNGKLLHGILRSLCESKSTLSITLMPESTEVTVEYQDIRVLMFSARLQEKNLSDFLRSHGVLVSLSVVPHEFSITYIDGSEMKGFALCLIMNGEGLHVFQANTGSVIQAFVPLGVVRNYSIAPRIAEVLASQKHIDAEQLAQALNIQETLRTKKIGDYLSPVLESEALKRVLDEQVQYDSGRLGDLLVEKGIISQKQLNDAVTAQQLDRKKKIGQILVEMGVVSEETVNAALAKGLGIPFVKLTGFDIDPHVLRLVSRELAQKHSLIPCMLYHDSLVIAIENAMDTEAIKMIRFTTGLQVLLTMATHEDIQQAIRNNYIFQGQSLDIALVELSEQKPDEKEIDAQEIERLGKEKPIVKFVEGIILESINRRASDIHLRPGADGVEILFRIDGMLVAVRAFNKQLLPGIVSRIKILGQMDITERRLPQDGSARIGYHGSVVDLRISVIPTVDGESVVIRILNTNMGLKSISDIGFSVRDERLFTDLLHRSNGIILVTGPTGSGKSTTLYAALCEIIKQNVNVITVEEPVEYHINGIEQIQVNNVTGLTFAKALRHILRHDPDVIMIGEIRDQETAKIAVESALTGHIVLSSLHTNNAPSAITRLMEIGIQSYLLNASVLAVLAQRLIRRNCPHCIAEEEILPTSREALKLMPDEVFYRGRGCDRCNQTGYIGRLAVYELLLVTPELRLLIKPEANEEVLRQQAIRDGMIPLTENALAQARLRKTSLEEVYRIRLE